MDRTSLQENPPDEVFSDRVIPACLQRFADELRLSAKAGDVLLVVDGISGGGILPIVDIIVQDRESGHRGDDIALRRRLLDFDRRFAVRQTVDKRGRDKRDNRPAYKISLIGPHAVVERLTLRIRNGNLRLVERIVGLERQVISDRNTEPQGPASRPILVEGELVVVVDLMVKVKAGGQALTEEVRFGERRLPPLSVLAVRNAQAHVLTAAKKVRFGVGEFGQKALGRRVTAAQAD